MRCDPITYEILSHRLFAINAEAASTIKLVSGSPVATEANDMNTGLMNAAGDMVAAASRRLRPTTLEGIP